MWRLLERLLTVLADFQPGRGTKMEDCNCIMKEPKSQISAIYVKGPAIQKWLRFLSTKLCHCSGPLKTTIDSAWKQLSYKLPGDEWQLWNHAQEHRVWQLVMGKQLSRLWPSGVIQCSFSVLSCTACCLLHGLKHAQSLHSNLLLQHHWSNFAWLAWSGHESGL